MKELTIFNGISKLFLLAVILGFVFMMLASAALAFHPGVNKNGTVPQGPHQIACKNPGRVGIDKAISNGGKVHCDCERNAAGRCIGGEEEIDPPRH